ncbi:MAG: ribulose-phosphate 3-epimerase [Candidatus Portnoybacteria bacterium]
MIEVIPTIIAKDFKELREKIERVESYVEWVQLDVMDGEFVENTTWPYGAGKNSPEDLKKLETNLNLEAHLMVKNPENVIESWISSGVKRIIVHFESSQKLKEVVNKVKSAGLEIGMAINPNTPIEVLDSYIPELDLVLVMTVEPGKGGQELIKDALVKIKRLQDVYPDKKIQVDGGVNLENAKELVNTGADVLAVGSAIFKSDNIKKVINQLKEHGN